MITVIPEINRLLTLPAITRYTYKQHMYQRSTG